MAIELDNSFAVPVPPEQAWDVLLDVARVAPCMPGATVDEVDGDVVTGKIRVRVGPISMTYSGKATFTERDAAAHAVRVEAAGKETRGAGTASATVQARLEEENGQTRVNVHTSLNVTGRPAQFGRGVMAEVSGKLIEKFSANLAEQLAAGDAQPVAAQTGDAASGEATGGQPAAETASGGKPGGPAAEAPAGPDARLGIPLQELNLPVRSFNSLKSAGIDTVGQLVARTPDDLLGIKNIGERSVEEIQQKLRDLGLALAQAPQQVTAAANGGPAEAPGGLAEAPAGPAMAGTREDLAAFDGGLTAAGPAGPGGGPEPEPAAEPGESADDAIDLLDVATGPILKRALPAIGAAIILIFLGFWLRKRLRSR